MTIDQKVYWDGQITSLTLRLYDSEDGYRKRVKYIAVAQLEMFSTGEAFMHAILKESGDNITMKQWTALAAYLLENFDIKVIHSERHGKKVSFDVVKLAEKFYKNQDK